MRHAVRGMDLLARLIWSCHNILCLVNNEFARERGFYNLIILLCIFVMSLVCSFTRVYAPKAKYWKLIIVKNDLLFIPILIFLSNIVFRTIHTFVI